jgi:hypothetical protein
LSIGPNASLNIQGPATLLNDYVLRFGSSMQANRGSISLQNVAVTLANDTMPVINGQLPGTMTAEIDHITIATLTCDPVTGLVNGTGPFTSFTIEAGWSSGGVTNANGRTFTLYLLPVTTFHFDGYGNNDDHGLYGLFGPDPSPFYSSLCHAAGLQPVGPGEWGGGKCQSRDPCMPLPLCQRNCHGEQHDASGIRVDWGADNNVPMAVHEHTGFSNFVMFSTTMNREYLGTPGQYGPNHPTLTGFDEIPCHSDGTCSQGPCTGGICLATGTTWGSGVDIYSKPRHPLCARQH